MLHRTRVRPRILWFTICWLTPLWLTHAAAAGPPNVLLILSDDQGSIDLNCYGATDLKTPHLDGLAKRGVRFTQFYAAAPVCSPSRAGLLTGRVPQRAGVPGNVSSQPGNTGMPTEQLTIAELLKTRGYRTGHVGKWHLGFTPETMPNGQGFDSSFGHMGGCIDNYSHFFYWNGANRHDLYRNGKEIFRDGEFFPDMMADECLQLIEQKSEKPFFIYWAINVPHYPLQGTERWRKVYKDLPAPRRMYAEFVSTMDETIGRVLTRLEELKLAGNTIVVFQSDHGHSTEVRTFGGGGNSGPYRGAKFSLFEGGLRVPAIISWPGHLPTNEVRTQLGTGCDWFPTIAELTETSLPDRKLDGKSLVQVIRSAKAATPHAEFHWQTGRNAWAVRSGDWKLLGNPRDTSNPPLPLGKDNTRFLVNLAGDIGERNNLAQQHPDIVKRLEQSHNSWLKQLK